MARRAGNLRFGVLILAFAIAAFLWGVAHGSSNVERGFDVPIELYEVDEALVVTDQSTDAINVRIRGSRAALRNVDAGALVYRLDASGGKRGTAEYEVDVSNVAQQLPPGANIVARSPSHVQIRLERKGRKAVDVRADVEGEPAEGYRVAAIEVTPRKVWMAGARPQVLRLAEVVTETIDIAGITETQERKARLYLVGGPVWTEENEPVTVRIEVEPDPALAGEDELPDVGAAEQETG